MISLYNTVNRKKEILTPVDKGFFSMYTCGPTVYRDAHIGNMRSYLMADWIKRRMLYSGYDVTHVKNITDVGHMRQEILEQGEDKMIAAAIAEGKTAKDIADFYTNRFLEDEEMLNIIPANHFPKATDNIQEMIKIVEDLLSKGFAYEVDSNVYFQISKFENYGKLSGNIHDSQLFEAMRIETDTNKRDPRDFTLWKNAEPGRELKWPSPWGEGFPGWHIECSAMSIKYLGEHFDLHTGGVDNIFPHHEGEIAQSESFLNHSFVSHWVHGQHLLADGVKMSKSAQNAYTVSDLSERNIDPMAFRYLCMTARYRTRLNFTFTSLKASEKALNRLKRLYVEWSEDLSDINAESESDILEWESKFISKIDDDLNLPEAVSLVWALADSSISNSAKYKLINKFDEILGLDLSKTLNMYRIPDSIKQTLEVRSELRSVKQYEEADSIREKINLEGYKINDFSSGNYLARLKDPSELRDEKWETISSSSNISSNIYAPSEFNFSIGLIVDGYFDDLKRCVNSIFAHDEHNATELIILDNGNENQIASDIESLADEFESIKVIHSDHRLVDASAKNALIKSSKGEMFVLIDTSVEFTGSFLLRLKELLLQDNVGVVGYAGLKTETLLHFHDGEGESGDVDAMQAYCFAFNRKSIREVGLMRECFRFYRNLDIDFSFQFKEKGYRIIADNNLPITLHIHRGWDDLPSNQRDDLSRKNYGKFLKKWRNREDLLLSNYVSE